LTRSSALRRRIVVVCLVLLSLVLITLSFRSSALDPVQGFGTTVLRPFEIAASRVSRPFRDAVGWAQGLVDAKSENEKLTNEVEALRRQAAEAEAAIQLNEQLQKLLDYKNSPRFPDDFNAVAASVLTNPTAFDKTITISAGSDSGIAKKDVVVTAGGLVGQVTEVYGHVALVMLITDPNSAVSAFDRDSPAAVGIIEHGSTSDSLVFSQVTKDKQVEVGDTIVTAGSPGEGQLPSLFPRNLVIGVVTSAGQADTDIFKSIQVQPYVDLGSLQSVLVLVPKQRRPGG
jgi:rod shape-determining protein MreC